LLLTRAYPYRMLLPLFRNDNFRNPEPIDIQRQEKHSEEVTLWKIRSGQSVQRECLGEPPPHGRHVGQSGQRSRTAAVCRLVSGLTGRDGAADFSAADADGEAVIIDPTHPTDLSRLVPNTVAQCVRAGAFVW